MELVAALIRALLASSAGLGAVVILLQVGDSYSRWVLDRSVSGGFTEGLKKLLMSPAANSLQIFVIVAGIIALIVSLIQICLLVVRSALSVLLQVLSLLHTLRPIPSGVSNGPRNTPPG